MPITVTAPRGVLTAHGEREILPQLTTALIERPAGVRGRAADASGRCDTGCSRPGLSGSRGCLR
ncbi:MAG TPA: hypothetical protein VKG80_02315, partial [Trebonia sp.]|nr:hypothetical protein [Trebonia sp.]